MKPDPFKLSLCAIAAVAITYTASYVGIRLVRPECINTNDGPVAAFSMLYYPLRYIDAENPAWYSETHDDWLGVKIGEINLGTGYLYFSWDGGQARAFCDSGAFHVGETALVHFRYELETRDDFRSQLVPTIDSVKRQPRGLPPQAENKK